MRITKTDIPVKIGIPGATARQSMNFGDASDYGTIAAEYFTLGAGTDIAPLLEGLHDNACQAPHWGYISSGEVVVSYTDGSEETCATNDVFYWPPGHSVRVTEDAEVILFSPQREHVDVMDHMLARLAG
jgi:hypothetical protein